MSDLQVEIRQLQPGDNVSGLSLGHKDFVPLKTFLKRDAHKFHANNLARTYGLFLADAPTKVAAYITLVCGEITANGLDANEPTFTHDHFPALKIARLAVHQDLRGQRIGETLTRMAIGIAKDHISPRVGCRFVTLDAKQQSIEFYRKQGFTLLDSDENKKRETPVMFLDLNKHSADPSA